jgi:hypothetical protein
MDLKNETTIFNCMMPLVSDQDTGELMPKIKVYDYGEGKSFETQRHIELLFSQFEEEFNINFSDKGIEYLRRIEKRFYAAWRYEDWFKGKIEQWKKKKNFLNDGMAKANSEVRMQTGFPPMSILSSERISILPQKEKELWEEYDKYCIPLIEEHIIYSTLIYNAEAALYLIRETRGLIEFYSKYLPQKNIKEVEAITPNNLLNQLNSNVVRVFATIYVLGRLGMYDEVELNKTEKNKLRIQRAIEYLKEHYGFTPKWPFDTIFDYAKTSKAKMFGQAFLNDDKPIVKEFLVQKVPNRAEDIERFLSR